MYVCVGKIIYSYFQTCMFICWYTCIYIYVYVKMDGCFGLKTALGDSISVYIGPSPIERDNEKRSDR